MLITFGEQVFTCWFYKPSKSIINSSVEDVKLRSCEAKKSIGISILLTLLLSPIGLFYSTILGGLVMAMIPLLLGAIFLMSIFSYNESLLMTSFTLLILFGLFWWIIAVVWGIFSVSRYNRNY